MTQREKTLIYLKEIDIPFFSLEFQERLCSGLCEEDDEIFKVTEGKNSSVILDRIIKKQIKFDKIVIFSIAFLHDNLLSLTDLFTYELPKKLLIYSVCENCVIDTSKLNDINRLFEMEILCNNSVYNFKILKEINFNGKNLAIKELII